MKKIVLAFFIGVSSTLLMAWQSNSKQREQTVIIPELKRLNDTIWHSNTSATVILYTDNNKLKKIISGNVIRNRVLPATDISFYENGYVNRFEVARDSVNVCDSIYHCYEDQRLIFDSTGRLLNYLVTYDFSVVAMSK
jgi:hypothetical protein